MDMYSIDDGKFAVIKTSKEFVLILDDEILGPFPCEKAVVKRIYQVLKQNTLLQRKKMFQHKKK